VILAWAVAPVSAAPLLNSPGVTNATSLSASAKSACVLFIFDDSGSMSGSDSGYLRYTAARLFVAAMDSGDQAGAMRFSDSATQIAPIAPLQDAAAKSAMIQNLAPVPPSGNTNVKIAIDEALRMFSSASMAGCQPVAVFLSDGQPTVSENEQAQAISSAKASGIPFYAIALSSSGQTAFLNQLAASTGAQVIPANDASDLLDSYLQILGALKDRTVLGSGANQAPGEATLSLDPGLAPYVDSIIFLVSKQNTLTVRVLDPSGQEITSSSPGVTFWSNSDPSFFAVSLDRFTGGKWTFDLGGSGTAQVRAILRSRLRARLVPTTTSGLIEVSQPLLVQANLMEEQLDGSVIKIVGEANFTAVVTLPDGSKESLVLVDDGTLGDKTAGDGTFSHQFVNTAQEGVYNITLDGAKGGVPVSTSGSVRAIQLPLLTIESPTEDAALDIRSDAVEIRLNTNLSQEELPNLAGGFKAQVLRPDGITDIVALTQSGSLFSGAYMPPQDGLYQVIVIPDNATYLGLPYHDSSPRQFNIRIVADLVVTSIQVGLASEDGGEPSFEVFQVQSEQIPLVVKVSSKSTRSVQLTASLDFPGFSLVESDPLTVEPNGESVFTLHLQGDPALTAGEKQGTLTLTAGSGVDLANGSQIIYLTVVNSQIQYSVLVGLKENDSLFELYQAQRSPIPLTVNVKSSTAYAVELQPSLSFPGFTLQENDPLTVPSNSETTFVLHMQGDTALTAGEKLGSLTLSGSDGVNVTNETPQIKLTLFEPRINFTLDEAVVTPQGVCYEQPAISFVLVISSTSRVTETITLSLSGAQLVGELETAGDKNTLVIPPGTSTHQLSVLPATNLSAGIYAGQLELGEPRPGLLYNNKSLPFSFTILPLWSACRKPLIFLGGMLILGVMIGAVIIKKAREAIKDPLLTGTLGYWPKGKAKQRTDIDLGLRNKSELTIGKGISCDIPINDPTLEDIHVKIKANRQADRSIIIEIEPLGETKKNFTKLDATEQIEDETEYFVGQTVLKYTKQLL